MNRIYSKFIFQNNQLHYSVSGEGEKSLLIFHGYGHTHKNMREIEEALQGEYKIYNFDLFFHGFSEWRQNDSPLTHEFWHSMLSEFLKVNQIKTFSVMGFSLGGKLALATVQSFEKQIQNLYLIAPDGLTNNFWYNTATSKPFKKLFRSMVLAPKLFFKLINVLERVRMLDKSTKRFALLQMNSRDKRRRVYYSWMVYKGIKPDLGLISKAINVNAIHVELYAGIYDRIIPVNAIQSFAKTIKNKKCHILNTGHNNLLDEVAYKFSTELEKR